MGGQETLPELHQPGIQGPVKSQWMLIVPGAILNEIRGPQLEKATVKLLGHKIEPGWENGSHCSADSEELGDHKSGKERGQGDPDFT